MPLNTRREYFVTRCLPPSVGGKDLHLARTRKSGLLYPPADLANIDDAVAHHAAIEQKVFGRYKPVTHMKREEALSPRTTDLVFEFRVPPDVVDIYGDAKVRSGQPLK
jgi:hypothetical protein